MEIIASGGTRIEYANEKAINTFEAFFTDEPDLSIEAGNAAFCLKFDCSGYFVVSSTIELCPDGRQERY